MQVIKANGKKALYDPKKIARSLKRSGASQKIIQEVIAETEKELFDGIHTKKLYKIIFRKLKKKTFAAAGKYHLKNAIMELGPTGFPFEKFIAALLEAEGYQTITNQIVQGRCVKHEIDVIAEKDNKNFMIECKFHGNAGNVCDIKHALYVYARFRDVKNSRQFSQGWLVTNTRLTGDAEKYSKCVGLGFYSAVFAFQNQKEL